MILRRFPLLLGCAALAALASGCATAPHVHQHVQRAPRPPARDADPRAAFDVSFSGIIMHATYDADPDPRNTRMVRRAIIVTGGFFGARHNPTLFVDDVDVASLRDASGQRVTCSGATCSVPIAELDLRITDNGTALPDGAPNEDRNYKCLLPHMRDDARIHGGDLATDLATDDGPSGPASGYFELAAVGDLTACPFGKGGRYLPDTTCNQFADEVFWSGSVAKGPAQLEIRSRATRWRWTPVRRTGTTLVVRVENLAASNAASTAHFALFEKLLPTATLPEIELCDLRPEDKCATCDFEANLVPGCSNTQWP